MVVMCELKKVNPLDSDTAEEMKRGIRGWEQRTIGWFLIAYNVAVTLLWLITSSHSRRSQQLSSSSGDGSCAGPGEELCVRQGG